MGHDNSENYGGLLWLQFQDAVWLKAAHKQT